jgi:hypothetical protein
MRKISIVLTVLITSLVMTLSGVVASPIASASENGDGSISATFASGSSVLTKAQKAAIKKALASIGTDVTYIVTGTAGKLPGVSDSRVQALAKARAKAIKAYLVLLGVNKTRVTTQSSTTEIGEAPKSVGSYPTPAPTPTATATANSTTTTPPTTATRISVAAIAGVAAPVTGATPVTTTTAGTGYTGTVAWSGSPATFVSATTYTATITLTPTSGYTLAGVTANFFTVAGATPVTNSANAGVITAVFPTTATTYAVGDRGPGGGIVFYVSAANFTSAGSTCGTACKYLEVAPATWQDTTAPINTDVSNDLIYQWSNNTTVATVQDRTTASTEGIVANRADEKVNWKIGQGFNNTSVMIVSSGATPPVLSLSAAQAAVLAYAGNSTAGQWFIPSMNELNELCKYARGQTTGVLTVACVTGTGIFKSTANAGTDLGGFVDYHYWSSSEFVASSTRLQNFSSGYQSNDGKGSARYVRPIRAF